MFNLQDHSDLYTCTYKLKQTRYIYIHKQIQLPLFDKNNIMFYMIKLTNMNLIFTLLMIAL